MARRGGRSQAHDGVGGKPAHKGRRAQKSRRKRRFSVAFEQFLELLDSDVRERGNACVLYPDRIGNFPLGHRATYYRHRCRLGFLSPEQVRVLEEARRFPGWSWYPLERRFAEGLRHLQRFVGRERHADVPAEHVEAGFQLGRWVSHRRHEHRAGRLPASKVRRLEAVRGWEWNPARRRFSEGLRHLRAFIAREGHARVPAPHAEGGFPLGPWVSHRRREHRTGVLAAHRVRLLDRQPGWTWDMRADRFETAHSLLLRFVRREGHARVPQKHVERGFPLGAWVARVRLRRRGAARGRLTREEAQRLESLSRWTWGRPRK